MLFREDHWPPGLRQYCVLTASRSLESSDIPLLIQAVKLLFDYLSYFLFQFIKHAPSCKRYTPTMAGYQITELSLSSDEWESFSLHWPAPLCTVQSYAGRHVYEPTHFLVPQLDFIESISWHFIAKLVNNLKLLWFVNLYFQS